MDYGSVVDKRGRHRSHETSIECHGARLERLHVVTLPMIAQNLRVQIDGNRGTGVARQQLAVRLYEPEVLGWCDGRSVRSVRLGK